MQGDSLFTLPLPPSEPEKKGGVTGDRGTAELLSDDWPRKEKLPLAVVGSNEKAASRLGPDSDPLTSPVHVMRLAAELTEAMERVQLTLFFLPSEGEVDIRNELFSCLQPKFKEAYTLAVEQARRKQRDAQDPYNVDLVACRREQEAIHREEMDRLRQKLEAEFREERKRQRRRAYQRQVKVLLTQQSEKKTEYQHALEQYYTHREGEQPATGTFSTRDESPRTRFTCDEEIAMRTRAESMNRDQVACLRSALRRLKKGVRRAKEHAQRSSVQRETSIVAARARARQQYLGIIAEQQNELRMLQHWYKEMQRLQREAEEIIGSYAEKRLRRREHMQREKEERVSSVVISGGEEDAGKGGSAAPTETSSRFQRGLFDLLL